MSMLWPARSASTTVAPDQAAMQICQRSELATAQERLPRSRERPLLGGVDKFRTEEMTAIADRQQGTERQDMGGLLNVGF